MTKSSSASSPYSAIKPIKCIFQHTSYGGFVVRPAYILHVIFFLVPSFRSQECLLVSRRQGGFFVSVLIHFSTWMCVHQYIFFFILHELCCALTGWQQITAEDRTVFQTINVGSILIQ